MGYEFLTLKREAFGSLNEIALLFCALPAVGRQREREREFLEFTVNKPLEGGLE